MNDLPAILSQLLQELPLLRSLQLALTKTINNQLLPTNTFYQSFLKKPHINPIIPLSSLAQSSKSLLGLTQHSCKILNQKQKMISRTILEINEIKGKKKTEENEGKAKEIDQRVREYFEGKFEMLKEVMYLGLNYRMDVLGKKVECCTGVLERVKEGMGEEEKKEILDDIFGQ